MFNSKSKTDLSSDSALPPSGASIIASGTSMKGDISSTGDLRIDGALIGNISCTAKVVIGANGSVEGDITGSHADIMGRVNGTIKVKELLQLKGGATLTGNIYAGKLQIETSANFNGQCHMTGSLPPVTPKPSSNGNGEIKSEKVVPAEPVFTLK